MVYKTIQKWMSSHYHLVIFTVSTGILLIIGAVFAYSSYRIMQEFTVAAYEQNQQIRKEFIQNTVDNLVADIERAKEEIRHMHPDWTQEQLDESITKYLRMRIYSASFKDGAYMWVHEVHNYAGGDRYATRLIHPVLSDTEGSYLTTEFQDANGNYPYKTELEGVRDHGALFQTYVFQRDSEDESTRRQRLSYSRLYPANNWIISMGIDTDTLEAYPAALKERMLPMLQKLLVPLLVVVPVLFVLGLRLVRMADRTVFQKESEELKQKANWDALTSANSRAYGVEMLEREYQASRSRDVLSKTAVMLLDVDNFKKFNDKYGHELGDKVLYQIVRAIRSASRSTDVIIRWGGDEFVGVYRGINHQGMEGLKNKILSAVRDLQIEYQGQRISVTVSVGFTFFAEEDGSYEDTLERADRALYSVKGNGRNDGRILTV